MTAYYNEIDPYAAQWLRNLIDAGHIAPGVVDERSIEDVRPDEIAGYTQCHFFAGIGVWSLALRNAGWSDDRPVWTGSCPCQPFSAAGKGAGFADERHLWPAFHWLVEQCRPPVLFGEQVASKIVDDWLDVVSSDLEGLGFAFGAVAFPAAGVGAPHIRDRTYFVADANHTRSQGRRRMRERAAERAAGESGMAGGLADTGMQQPEQLTGERSGPDEAQSGGACREPSGHGDVSRLADALCARSLPGALAGIHRGEKSSGPRDGEPERLGDARELADAANVGFDGRGSGEASDGRDAARIESERLRFVERIESAGPTNGFWRTADWLSCRDEKWRPVEPGTFPLADGAPSRVGRLRAYGNAIVAEAAQAFIKTAMECLPCEA